MVATVQLQVTPVESGVRPFVRSDCDVGKVARQDTVPASCRPAEDRASGSEPGCIAGRRGVDIESPDTTGKSQGMHPETDASLDLEQVHESHQLVVGIKELDRRGSGREAEARDKRQQEASGSDCAEFHCTHQVQGNTAYQRTKTNAIRSRLVSGWRDAIIMQPGHHSGASMPASGVEIRGSMRPRFGEILSPAAVDFLAMLHRGFNPRRLELLDRRKARQRRLDAGELPGFLEETRHIRESDWRVHRAPADLENRRVEITGPTDRKMVINALNSGANVFMADFEDATSPTWTNLIEGQLNLRDAIERTIEFTGGEGKSYRLNPQTATLLARPRGWHLDEAHVLIDGVPLSGSLFDFGLYFFHNARRLMDGGSGPYFYLPKLESHLEARLWNDVFNVAQDSLGVPQGTIKVTVLIETILATFEMDEILYELKEHIVGLNCGRWDYIFSFIKKFRNHPQFVLPDRATVGMDRHFLRSYTQLVVKTCHRRGAHAMGGMAAQIPIKNDPAANQAALDKVITDKKREVGDGHDGTWVAHPGLVGLAREIFDAGMPAPNQLDRLREDVNVTAKDLLAVPEGKITEQGVRHNITIGLLYLEAWLNGLGCVPIFNLMEDAATAEISRGQVWQWIRHRARLDDGRTLTPELYRTIAGEELQRIRALVGEARFAQGKYGLAEQIFDRLITASEFTEFLTLPAYEELLKGER
jgi:malate synthase